MRKATRSEDMFIKMYTKISYNAKRRLGENSFARSGKQRLFMISYVIASIL